MWQHDLPNADGLYSDVPPPMDQYIFNVTPVPINSTAVVSGKRRRLWIAVGITLLALIGGCVIGVSFSSIIKRVFNLLASMLNRVEMSNQTTG